MLPAAYHDDGGLDTISLDLGHVEREICVATAGSMP